MKRHGGNEIGVACKVILLTEDFIAEEEMSDQDPDRADAREAFFDRKRKRNEEDLEAKSSEVEQLKQLLEQTEVSCFIIVVKTPTFESSVYLHMSFVF